MVKYRELAVDPDYRVGTDGSVWSKKRGEWVPLKLGANRDGYPEIKVGGKKVPVHKLILESFIGPRPEGLKARHKNDVKTDNRLENLAWGTNRENHDDAVKNGRVVPKLDEAKARQAVILNDWGWTNIEIGDLLGVSGVAIQKVLAGKLWAEATGIPPRRRDDFEGPKTAYKAALLRSWEWAAEEIAEFLGITLQRTWTILRGGSYSEKTAATRPPTRREVIKGLDPEIVRLYREGVPTKEIAGIVGVSLRKVQYAVKAASA